MRANSFQNSPELWEIASLAVVESITKMVQENILDFFAIYDFARKERARIAKELNHKPLDYFGVVRTLPGGDEYIDAENDALFPLIKNTMASQFNFFLETKKEHALYLDLADGWFLIYTPAINKVKQRILAKYPEMNEASYSDYLLLLQPAFRNILAAKTEDEFVFKLGLLIYDLSKLILLQRGSAAVNLWIANGIGNTRIKNFSFKRINGIPFDIYAQIQLDRRQYAIDFAKSIKAGFEYHQNHMTMTMLERKFLKSFVEKILELLSAENRFKIEDGQKIYTNLKQILATDFASLHVAFNHIKVELTQALDIPMEVELKNELGKFVKYADIVINGLKSHTELNRQYLEGNYTVDNQAFVLTEKTLPWFQNDPGYFFSNKKQVFVKTLLSSLQIGLEDAFYAEKNQTPLKFFTVTLNSAYYGNPVTHINNRLEEMKNKEWDNPLDALIELEQLFKPYSKVAPPLSKAFECFLYSSHKNITALIDEVKQKHSLEYLMGSGIYLIMKRNVELQNSSKLLKP